MGSTLSALTGAGQPPPASSASSGRSRGAAEAPRITKASVDAKVSGWIADKKLAPREQSDGRAGQPAHECPICFIDYIALNETKCCHCTICTDCFSQLLLKGEAVVCPFCTAAIQLAYADLPGGAAGDTTAPTGQAPSSPPEAAPATAGMKEILFSSVEARRELEAEMTAHRHLAGDVEDIEVVDRRARSMSLAARMAAHMNRAGGRRSNPPYRAQQLYGMHSHLGDNSSDEEYEQIEPFRRREPLPYLRGRAVTAAASRTPTSRSSVPRGAPPPRDEWLALHDLLVNARHSEAGIGDEHVSGLEERMLEQAMRQSLIDSGGPVAETLSASPAQARPTAAAAPTLETASESEPRGSEIRLSDLSLASADELDEDAQLELALALSLAEAQNSSSAENITPPESASVVEQETIAGEGSRQIGRDDLDS